MTWSKEWPREQGFYWLYGKLWSDDKETKFHMVEVWKISNGYSYVAQGHFITRYEGACGVWQPVVFPEVPVVE